MPDRYIDAVRARRVELRAWRGLLTGGHRAELRSCLALSRIAAAAEASGALAGLAREAADHIETGDRAARGSCPTCSPRLSPPSRSTSTPDGRWPCAPRCAGSRPNGICRWIRAGPGCRHRSSRRCRQRRSPPVACGRCSPVLPTGPRSWRLALFPVAMLPLLGLPALAGPALAPLAAGAGVAAVAATARARRTAAERARLRCHTEQVLAAAALAIDADLGRRLVELERTVVAALDAAVLRRRAAVDAELALLAPDNGGVR